MTGSKRSFVSLQSENNPRAEAKIRTTAFCLLLLSTVLIGSGNVAQVTGLDSIGPFTLTFLRSIVAVVVLLPFAIREQGRAANWNANILPCMVTAAAYFGASIILQQIGAQTTTATNIGFLINMSAVFVPMLLWLTTGQSPAVLAWPSAAMAVIGAYLVTGAGQISATVGDALCLLAGVFDGVWIIALAVAMPKCRAPATLVLLMFMVTGVMSAPFIAFETVSASAIASSLPEILWLGVMTSAFGFLFSTKAQEHLEPCTVAILFCCEALVSAILGRFILSETMTILSAVGAGLIVLAVLVSQLSPSVLLKATSEPLDGPLNTHRKVRKTNYLVPAN